MIALLLTLSLVCFLAAAAGVPSKFSLVPFGLAFFVMAQLWPLLPKGS